MWVLASCMHGRKPYLLCTMALQSPINFSHRCMDTALLLQNFLTMPGKVHWAMEEQTKFLVSHFSEYIDIYNTSKAYGPFWAKIKVDWLKLFPVDAGSMFLAKSDNELTAKDEAAVGMAIKKLMKVQIMVNDLGDIFHMTNMPSKSKIGSDGVWTLPQSLGVDVVDKRQQLRFWVRCASSSQRKCTQSCSTSPK